MSLDVSLHDRSEICPHCGHNPSGEVFSANITHNLTEMASEAGMYEALWRPDERGYTKARQIIPVLEQGIAQMKERPGHFQAWDSPNGWGTYRDFLPWLEEYLKACREFPDADIEVDR